MGYRVRRCGTPDVPLSMLLALFFLPLQEFEVFQIEISKAYGKFEWHEDIKKVLKMAGEANQKVRSQRWLLLLTTIACAMCNAACSQSLTVRMLARCCLLPAQVVFLFADTQIVQEGFVEDMSNLLNTYEVPNLMQASAAPRGGEGVKAAPGGAADG